MVDFLYKNVKSNSVTLKIQLELFVTKSVPYGESFSGDQHHSELTCR